MACKDHPIGATLCWHGVCQATTRNHTEGELCSSLNMCENAFYCNNTNDEYAIGTCLKYLAKGDNCSNDNDLCGSQLICNLGTCVNYFSVAIGGACDTLAFYSPITACAADSYCSWNATTSTGLCAKGFPSSNTPCNITCTDSREVCVCQQNGQYKCIGPRIATPSQAKDFQQLDACINSSNCDIEDINCCHEHQCTFYNVILGGGFESECGYSNPWSYCSSSKSGLTQAEKIGIVAAVVAGVALILALVVVAVRKRKQSQYSKI